MHTAQNYFDSLDKEAMAVKNIATAVANRIPRSGAGLGRLPNSFGVPVPKVNQAAGIKTKPFSPIPKSDIAKPKNWVTNPVKNFKQAGAPNNPLQQAQTVRAGSGQIRI